MVKFLVSIFSGVAIGVFGTIFTLNWQEENLQYEISPPAQFGDIIYQNLIIKNEGWNPAVNIKILLNQENIDKNNIYTAPKFNLTVKEENFIGGYDRLRRNEHVTISFSYSGEIINPSNIRIKSDRSIATLRIKDGNKFRFDALSFTMGLFGIVFLSIIIPQYRSYKKRAKQHAEERAKSQDDIESFL